VVSVAPPKILLFKWYKKRSSRGARYGCIGAAKVITFLDADAELQLGAELGLPTAPPKPADRRGKGIAATTQAEAIPPDVLAQIAREAILERLDGDGYHATLEQERSTRRELARRLRGIEGKP